MVVEENFIRSLISEKVVSSAANFFPVGPKREILNVLVELPKLGKSVTSGLWAILYILVHHSYEFHVSAGGKICFMYVCIVQVHNPYGDVSESLWVLEYLLLTYGDMYVCTSNKYNTYVADIYCTEYFISYISYT